MKHFPRSLGALALVFCAWGLRGEAQESPPERDEPAASARIEELQDALLRELDLLEARLASLKGRIRRLCLRMGVETSALDDPAGGGPPDSAVLTWRSVEDEEENLRLRKREEALVAAWRKLGWQLARLSGEDADVRREKLEAERKAIRSSLRDVLRAELELRDRARRLEVERLRQDLAGIERILRLRSSSDFRRKLVESRLRDLLREVDEESAE